MTDRADRTIKVLRSSHDELAAMARGFTGDDLARTSGSSEWDISQVLSHLGSGAEIFLALIQGALDGSGSPGGDFNQGVWARWDAMSREERAEGFLTANETLVSRFEGLDAETLDTLRIDTGFMPEPLDVGAVAGMRLTEFAHHLWDVKVAFDPAATLDPEATDLLVDQAGMLIGFLGKADALDGRTVTIAVHTASPERSFGLDIRDAVSLVDAPTAPDAVLTAPAEWWLRLVTGRHSPAHTPAEVRLSGDSVTLDDLRRLFIGF
jgi:uncharacterized protein (TIGR03083 family)